MNESAAYDSAYGPHYFEELKLEYLDIISDLLASDFNKRIDSVRSKADVYFQTWPELKTEENLEYFGMKS